MTQQSGTKQPTITFDRSAAESVVESFGWRVCDTGIIKNGFRMAPSFHGGAVEIDDFAGVVEYEGEPVLLRDDFCDIVDYAKYREEIGGSRS